jgi:hypothetical protein
MKRFDFRKKKKVCYETLRFYDQASVWELRIDEKRCHYEHFYL